MSENLIQSETNFLNKLLIYIKSLMVTLMQLNQALNYST